MGGELCCGVEGGTSEGVKVCAGGVSAVTGASTFLGVAWGGRGGVSLASPGVQLFDFDDE